MPIGDLFYKGKNPRGKKIQTTTPKPLPEVMKNISVTSSEDIEEDYDYDDIWAEYMDTGEHSNITRESRPAQLRISPQQKSLKSKKEDQQSSSEFLSSLPRDIYCDLVTTLDTRCSEFSLLEIWDFDEEIIRSLSQEDILDAVNTLTER